MLDNVNKNKSFIFFFCSKFSDLDNMLPVLFIMLDKDKKNEAYIFWYGSFITYDSKTLLTFAKERFRNRLSIYFIGRRNLSKLSLESSKYFKKYGVIGKFQTLLNILSNKCLGDQKNNNVFCSICSLIKEKLENSNFRGLAFFGFSNRDVLNKVSELTININLNWVRLPQGVRFTISTFRHNYEVNHPNQTAVTKYKPPWAKYAIEVDDNMYNNFDRVFGFLGKNLNYERPLFLGSPRFSSEWIKKIDSFYSTYETVFKKVSKKNKRILFLLTPWHKNVWFEETLKVLDIITTFDVFLVVKGFHSNTTKSLKTRNYIFDENTPTSLLVRDADAIIYIATSAALEGYIRSKEMLQLSYLHGNQTVLEKNGLGHMAKCRDDVHIFMKNFIKNGSFSKGNEVDTICRDFIINNIVGNNCSDAYYTTLSNLQN